MVDSNTWRQFVQQLESEFGSATVDRWVNTLYLVEATNSKLLIEAQDSFQALWFEEHIRPRLFQLVDSSSQSPLQVQLRVKGAKPAKKKKIEKKPLEVANTFNLPFEDIDPTALFEQFIASEENEIILKLLNELCQVQTQKKLQALAALASTHQSLPAVPNPIFLYGPSGSGKTHLLMAIAHRLRRSGINALYARAELFTEHVIRSIRAGEMSAFRSLWRKADVLLFDDIQSLAKKAATQEEFFHTFNSLHLAGKQIVITSNCLPLQLQHIEPRLVSRFEWGIVLPCVLVSKKQLSHLLEQKAHLLQFPLTPRITEFLIETFGTNPKSCVKALQALVLRLQTTSSQKSLKLIPPLSSIKDILADLIEEEKQHALTGDKVIMTVAEVYGITPKDIIGKSQTKEFVVPRQIAMFLARKLLKLPYMKIGELLQRDHSTVMSAIRHIEKQISAPQSDVGSMIASIEIRLAER